MAKKSEVNWKPQLILAAILFGMGTLAYWHEYSYKPKKESSEADKKKVFRLKDDSISVLNLSGAGGKDVEIRCMEKDCKVGAFAKWEVTQPKKFRADDSVMSGFLNTVGGLAPADTIDLSTETPEKRQALLKMYKLDEESRKAKSAKRILVTTADGKTQALYLGELHPIGDNIFSLAGEGTATALKMDESKVFLVNNSFKANLENEATHWRDKKLFTLSVQQILSFTLKGTKSNIEGERKDGQWLLKANISGKWENVPGDIENIDNSLGAVVWLTAKGFPAENKNDAKARSILASAKKVVTVTLKGGAPEKPTEVTLNLFEKKKSKGAPDVYATVSDMDPLFELDSSAVGRVDKSLKEVRLSKLITSLERFGAKRIEIAGKPLGSKPLKMTQKQAKWLLDGGDEADSMKVQALLDKLSGARVRDYLSLAKAPAGEADGLKVTVGDDKFEKKRQLVFWKKGEELYAKDLDAKIKEVFQVDPAIRDALPWDSEFFKKTKVQ